MKALFEQSRQSPHMTLRLLVVSALLVATPLSVAGAADMAVKAPANAVAPVTNWTGCYAGGNLGWLRGGDSEDLAFTSLNPLDIFSRPVNSDPLDHSYKSNGSAWTGGLQAGCNHQAGAVVLGVEGDINSSSPVSVSGSYGPTGPINLDFTSSHTETVTNQLDWFSTLRGRFGFAVDRLLIYGTGGLAVAQIRSTTNVVFGSDQFFLAGNAFSGSDTVTRGGWVAGAGAEWAIASTWSLKAEYLHLGFGSLNYTSACVSATCNPFAGLIWSTSVRARDDIVRVGANFKFN
jgi:outer membrane immunogenic protein